MSTDSANAFFNAWDEGQTQFTVHSSGSTGHPKTIHLDRQWMEWSAKQTATSSKNRSLIVLFTN